MIGNMLNKTEVGYFATAGKFVDLILFLPAILVQTITPILVREKNVILIAMKQRNVLCRYNYMGITANGTCHFTICLLDDNLYLW